MSEIPPLAPDDDSTSEATSNHRRRLWKILGGLSLGLGSIVIVGGVVFYVWGNRIVTSLLLPRVADALDESIKRPVELGDVEGFSFWGVRLGKTIIPSTETDDSSVTVDGIEINIGLRSLLFQRTLKSRVVLIRPEASLIENEDGQWLELTLPEPSEAERPIELEIESVEVRDASLSAMPYTAEASEAVVPRERIQIEDVDGLVELFGESAQEAKFKLDGKVLAQAIEGEKKKASGNLALKGNANLETQTGKINAKVKNLPSVGANLLLPDSLGLRSGELDGNLTVAADFDEGVLEQSSLDVQGNAQFRAGELVVDALESPIQNIRSRLKFSGQKVNIKDTSLQLGEAILLVEGDVDVEDGYAVTAQVPSVTVAEVKTLADVDLPIAAEGAFTLVTDVTGALNSPNVEGRLASLEPLLIDKVSVDSASADFSTTLPDFELAQFNLDAFRVQPTTGGVITANGQADLSDLENVTFQLGGNANLPTDAIAQTYGLETPPEIVLGRLNADFEVAGDLDNQTASADWRLSQGLVLARGRANATANAGESQQLSFQLSGQANAPVDVVAQAYDVALPEAIVLGRLSADFEAAGDLENQTASADWRLSQGLISAIGQANIADLQQPEFQLSGQANAPVDVVARAYDVSLPEEITLGRLSADFEAAGDLENQTASADWRLSQGLISAIGQANVTDLQQLSFQLSGRANAPVDLVAQAYDVNLPEETVLGTVVTGFEASGNLDSQTASADWQLTQGSILGHGNVLLIDKVVALENARLSTDEGAATAAATLDLDTQNWQATANTDQIAVGQFTGLASGLLSADLVASGNLSESNVDQIEASGNALIANAQVQLAETSAPLLARGDWTTAFEWQGDRIAINSFSAPGLQADGIIGVDLAQDIPIGDLALNVALQSYDLQRINGLLPDSVSKYAQLDGFTSFDGQLLGSLDNPQLSGNAQLDNLAVNYLQFETLSGPLNFALADGGRINLQGQQDRLQLVAVDAPQKAVPFWPVSFAIRNQDFVARGETQGDVLRAEVVQLPLERLAIAPAAEYGLGTVTGLLQADITANLADFSNPTATGTLSVTDPSLAPVAAERFNAEFAYGDGTATLNRGELLFDQSRYLLSGSANLGAKTGGDVAYQGELAIAQGRIEDLIPIAQALELGAFRQGAAEPDPDQRPMGTAADLDVEPRGWNNGTLLDKLERYVTFLEANPEVAAVAEGQIVSEDQTASEDPLEDGELLAQTDLPPLDELEGEFTGKIAFAGSSLAPADATVDFNLQGDSWQWGENTPPNEFALRGKVAQSTVDIDTAFVNAGETQVNLVAEGNLDQLNGKLVVNNLPVALAQLVYPLPADVEGDLDLTTTFGGSLTNPKIAGQAAIANPQINDYALTGLKTDFTYRNALLAVNAEVTVDEQVRPISVQGKVPYAPAFVEVAPSTDRLSISAIVPNGNLEIINALTDDKVQWQSGQGELTLGVGGTLSQPKVMGKASFRDAVVSSTLLADDVTNLSGNVLFDLEQVTVQQFQAQIDDGRLFVDGQLPLISSGGSISALLTPGVTVGDLNDLFIQQPSPAQQPPATGALRVALEKLPIDYSELVSGIFNGQLLVTGAALTPTVTGNIEVDNGLVNATNVLQQVGSSSIGEIEVEEGTVAEAINAYRRDYLGVDPNALEVAESSGAFDGILEKVAIRDLTVSLGNRLTIAARPIFRVTALGGLSVNGTLAELRPAGTIELQTGQVNLFASQFRLDRAAPNTATFTPENGLDPVLDVELLARVQDTDINTLPSSSSDGFMNSEVDASSVNATGEVQFIRVRAAAQGPASEITDNLTLSSRPDRDEEELLTLLSSSTVTGLTSASLTELGGFLGGGGGRLATFGDRVADAVGLQSFRVFPTTDVSEDSPVGFGIGVEASAAIGDRFNVTFSDILNNNNAPQLGVLYRITEELNVRGASNVGDTNLEVEYRLRF